MTDPTEDEDEALFQAAMTAARDAPPVVPAALMARVLGDAAAQQPRRWRLSALIGGWQGLGGLVAATCAGLWIGWSAPEGLPDPVVLMGGDAMAGSVAAFSSFGWDMEEG
ncbi:hypothetical protein [uncultured Roseobacter sp.]|uniref:hypothetical protein n=1 Tax=uncultured Roseobacter sp. TaxID=114847 RepID=UPI00260F4F61|nr:hypothetical protein [uncultured Roseobacter sp.]